MNSDAPLPSKSAWLHSVKAVLWSFIGLRRNGDGQQDFERLHPLQILVVAIGAALLFVLGLIALVNWVATRSVGP